MTFRTTLNTCNISCMIIFLTDNHMNEYIHKSDNIVTPLTGFTGSTATVLITSDHNFLYTDGRYFIQAEKELKDNFVLKKIDVDQSYLEYIRDNVVGNIGMDVNRVDIKTYKMIKNVLAEREIIHVRNELFCEYGERTFNDVIDLEVVKMKDCIWLFEHKHAKKLVLDILKERDASEPIASILEKSCRLVSTEKQNNVDQCKRVSNAKDDSSGGLLKKWHSPENIRAILENSPHESQNEKQIIDDILNSSIAGISSDDKIALLRHSLDDSECMIISLMDEIAYLLNLRGTDIPYNLLFFSYMFVDKKNAVLFTNSKNVKRNVCIRSYDEFECFLDAFYQNTGDIKLNDYTRVYVSLDVNAGICIKLGCKAVVSDFIQKLKSVKNTNEIVGIIQANIIDGIALTRLFVWIKHAFQKDKITEIQISKKLLEIKRELCTSFANKMKADVNNHGSCIEDSITNKYLSRGCFVSESFESIVGVGSNAAIIHYKGGDINVENNNVLLMDSGSQFLFGTTDITRTLFLGKSPSKFREYFTRVLKGQITSKTLIAPQDRFLQMVCNVARLYLWNIKCDYRHGTSHGVGHSSLVHESLPFRSIVPHQMFSVEPGVYLENEFGVRIEDVVMAIGDEYLNIVDLSYVPLQRNLIVKKMLLKSEAKYLNGYNDRVRKVLSPFLNKEERKWVKRQTRRIFV
ncbi:Xaa-Pro aminopeptidase [Trachipleistophora hominis]|uniref:Xaa-Pro aminopeptidase n=1 Tax=Trachipleistophora hominis TaxID=72359 RepID=L7JXG6_TRAHO|nr:Xaa-Pro aminopeptidase [Trachipleistophora hominis]